MQSRRHVLPPQPRLRNLKDEPRWTVNPRPLEVSKTKRKQLPMDRKRVAQVAHDCRRRKFPPSSTLTTTRATQRYRRTYQMMTLQTEAMVPQAMRRQCPRRQQRRQPPQSESGRLQRELGKSRSVRRLVLSRKKIKLLPRKRGRNPKRLQSRNTMAKFRSKSNRKK